METEFLIIGSGPAGVSAAWPLLQAGRTVTMIDGGTTAMPDAPKFDDFLQWTQSPDRWRHMLGTDLGGLTADSRYSPKFATPLGRAVMEGSAQTEPSIDAHNAIVSRASAIGGLSTIWGAFCTAFDDSDMQGFPIGTRDLSEGYRAVAERIGITGQKDDLNEFHGSDYPLLAPPSLDGPAASLLDGYGQKQKSDDFRLGLARNAVLTEARSKRHGCVQCGLCLYGCAHKSIYNSADEIDALKQFQHFHYSPQTIVKKILPLQDGKPRVEVIAQKQTFTLTARKILLAAGTINSTALVLDFLQMTDVPVPVLHNPVAGMAFLLPRHIGRAYPQHNFGLGRLSYRLSLDKSDYATGVVYAADTLPLHLFAERMPFSRPTSLQLSAMLAPAMLMSNCYVNSSYSNMILALTSRDGRPKLTIKGETKMETSAALTTAGKKLASAMRHYGAFRVPGSFTITPPGSDAHLAGTMPMGSPSRLGCNTMGELNAAPGIHVIDGSWLPRLPPKHCTFTIMANATRVAKTLGTPVS